MMCAALGTWSGARVDVRGVMLLVLVGCSSVVQPTPPPATTPADIVALSGAAVMIGVGDIARCGSAASQLTAMLVDSVLRADSAANVKQVVFTLGDNAYASGTALEFAQCFTPTWGAANRLIMKYIRPAPGNHEYFTLGADAYYKYFGKSAGEPGKGYYSYSIGEWHAVSLNSEIMVNPSFTSAQRKEQEDWLEKDLKDNSRFCTVAYWHHPRFSSGHYGHNVALTSTWRILYEYDVDLILAGHEHHYERFAPQTPDGVSDTLRGITQIVAGTGGGGTLRAVDRHATNSVFLVVGRYGVLLLTLGGKEFRSAFLEVGGREWDHSGGKCH